MLKRFKHWYAETPRLVRIADTELATIVLGFVLFVTIYATGNGFNSAFSGGFIFGYLIPFALLVLPQHYREFGFSLDISKQNERIDEMEQTVWNRAITSAFAAATLYFVLMMIVSMDLYDSIQHDTLERDYFWYIMMGYLPVSRAGWCAAVLVMYNRGVGGANG